MSGPEAAPGPDLLGRVLTDPPPAFALLHRPETGGAGQIDLLTGAITTPPTLLDIPLPPTRPGPQPPRHDALVVIPYRQLRERGLRCVDDGAPLLVMSVAEQATVPLADVLERIPPVPTRLRGGHFELADDAYAQLVSQVIADEISAGQGANFVLKRTFLADLPPGPAPAAALGFFRRLLTQESGAYWTFLVHTGERTFVGASPEQHLRLAQGMAVMNPISGTYRYPRSGPTLTGVLDFLKDRKETDELYMVLDEELKMMARVCDTAGQVRGPYLREMARVAHTEYVIEGRSSGDPREMLRETLFAPTVIGSPLESACRVIARYEPEGRRYYSGVVALLGRDARGGRTLDSAILIRTAEITGGQVRIAVGATLVRHSNPASEVAETHAKAAGLLAAPDSDWGSATRFADHPRVRAALRRRNEPLGRFWLAGPAAQAESGELWEGKAVVLDAEDTFAAMLDHQLRSLGLSVVVRRFDEPLDLNSYDFVVMGPGPGDPRADDDPRMERLSTLTHGLLVSRRPFLAVCLSHQVLSQRLGLRLRRRAIPNQGTQRQIDLFGHAQRVGFYNSFVATSACDYIQVAGIGPVAVCRDAATQEVHALRGPHFASVQFHVESVLTPDGVGILRRLVGPLLTEPKPGGLSSGVEHYPPASQLSGLQHPMGPRRLPQRQPLNRPRAQQPAGEQPVDRAGGLG